MSDNKDFLDAWFNNYERRLNEKEEPYTYGEVIINAYKEGFKQARKCYVKLEDVIDVLEKRKDDEIWQIDAVIEFLQKEIKKLEGEG